MKQSAIPFLFFSFLLIILAFIVGVRYGQRIERANKTISYLVKLSPSPKPIVEVKTQPQFVAYNDKDCGVKFLYQKDSFYKIECDKITPVPTVVSGKDGQREILTFTIYNTIKKKNVNVSVEKNLQPIFESTVQFLP